MERNQRTSIPKPGIALVFVKNEARGASYKTIQELYLGNV